MELDVSTWWKIELSVSNLERVYEAPGATLIHMGHDELQRIVHDRATFLITSKSLSRLFEYYL